MALTPSLDVLYTRKSDIHFFLTNPPPEQLLLDRVGSSKDRCLSWLKLCQTLCTTTILQSDELANLESNVKTLETYFNKRPEGLKGEELPFKNDQANQATPRQAPDIIASSLPNETMVKPEDKGLLSKIDQMPKDLSGIGEPSSRISQAFGSIPAESGSSNFLRRISQKDWDDVVLRIKEHGRLISEEELTAFQKGNWEHPVFKDPNWALFAFQAFLANKLDEDMMCKLFLYDACQKQVAADNAPPENWKAYCLNRQLFTGPGVIDKTAAAQLKKAAGLSSSEFAKLCELLKDLPCEQTQFFLLHRTSDALMFSVWGTRNSMGVSIVGDLEDERNGKTWVEQLVAPPSLMYLIYQVKFGKDAIRPVSHLGYAPVEDMSDPSTRIVSVPSLFALPDVHNLSGAPLSIYHHDVGYHLILESANPHRPFWINFAKCLQNHLKDRDDIEPKLKEMILEYAWDREFERIYLKYEDRTPAYRFWMSLVDFCETAEEFRAVLDFENEEKNIKNMVLDCFIEAYQSDSTIAESQLNMQSLQKCYSRFREIRSNHELEENDKKLKEQLYDYIRPKVAG